MAEPTVKLAEKVVELAEGDTHFQFVYNEEDSVRPS